MVLDRAVGSAASATPTREVAVHPDGDAQPRVRIYVTVTY